MSDEAALLTAIAAHPDEDTPRLAYADWLQKNGQSVRAEFIRLQIEIARIDHLPRAVLNRYVHLFERNQELIDDHRAELLGPLAALPAGVQIEFRRGFVSQVTLDAALFPRFADTIAGLNLRPHVTLFGAAARLDELADVSHHLAIVSTLRMQSASRADPTQLTPADVWSIFVMCWPWDSLQELDLEACRMGDEGMSRLTGGDNLTQLATLDLSGNDLTDHAVDTLVNSSLPMRLNRLILGGNDITDIGAVALAEQWPAGNADRLEYLNLRFTNIGQVGQAALLRRFGGRVDLF